MKQVVKSNVNEASTLKKKVVRSKVKVTIFVGPQMKIFVSSKITYFLKKQILDF